MIPISIVTNKIIYFSFFRHSIVQLQLLIISNNYQTILHDKRNGIENYNEFRSATEINGKNNLKSGKKIELKKNIKRKISKIEKELEGDNEENCDRKKEKKNGINKAKYNEKNDGNNDNNNGNKNDNDENENENENENKLERRDEAFSSLHCVAKLSKAKLGKYGVTYIISSHLFC